MAPKARKKYVLFSFTLETVDLLQLVVVAKCIRRIRRSSQNVRRPVHIFWLPKKFRRRLKILFKIKNVPSPKKGRFWASSRSSQLRRVFYSWAPLDNIGTIYSLN